MSNTEDDASHVKCWAAGLHKHRADLKNTIEALRKTQAKKASTAERDSLRSLLDKKPKKGHQVIFGRKSESKMNALLVPNKGLISRHEDIINAIEDYFQKQATPVLPKTGKFLPHDNPRTYPWSRGSEDVPESFTITRPLEADTEGPATLPVVADYGLFQNLLQRLPNGKAPGPDGIPNELLKHLPTPVLQVLHKLQILMYATGCVPTTWKQSMTVLIPKKGDTILIKNWRPITGKHTLQALHSHCHAHPL
jgi:hypothetical protein